MSTQTAEQAPTLATATTLTDLFLARTDALADRVALRRKVDGVWEDVTWRGYREAATKIGLGLRKLGLERGDAVALISNTRVEWAFCDLGILGAGGVTIPIYQSNLPDEIAYIVENSGAKFMFLEDLDQYKKIEGQLDGALASIKHFVIFDTRDTQATQAADTGKPWEQGERFRTLDAFLALAEGEDPEAFVTAAREAKPGDPVTYIYTSGTTGKPKGVVLTHGNAMGECVALQKALVVSPDDVTLMFLPLAHVFARALHWAQIRSGFVCAFAEEITKVVDNMSEIRPTFFAAVPRIYEKIHQAVIGKVNAESGLKKKYVLWALEGAIAREKARNAGQAPGLGAAVRCGLGGPALGKLKAGLSARTGGRVRFFVSGGAPLSREIAFFLKALGFEILEGYGLTETTAATHVNRVGACRIGTVGQCVEGAEHKIAPDGEVMLRGTMVMREYYQRPEDTAEVMKDGWFYTGDVGEIDADGYLRITDRKKDLIITAAGKNIAPQNVENHIKTHPLVSQVAMFGDQRKFCVALLTVDEEATRKALAAEGVSAPATYAELAAHPRVRELIQAALDAKNADLPSYETIKYFELLPEDFAVGAELTPSLKVKRPVVKEKYGALVDALYAKHGG